VTTGVIDCGISHSWASDEEIIEYLPSGWREYMIVHSPHAWHSYLRGEGARPAGALVDTPLSSHDLAYSDPREELPPDVVSGDSLAGCSDYATLDRHHLQPCGIDRGLLVHGTGLLVPAKSVVRLTDALARAINDWTIERWLAEDDRLYASLLVPTQVPDLAAAEIRRLGPAERIVAVLLCANGLGRPFGHPAYDPIYRAAAELDLPIIIRAGGDELMESSTYSVAGGLPRTYVEHRTLAPQVLMTHAASLIGQGVMKRYPSLRFLLLGGSMTWVTPFLWRLDAGFRSFRHDVLWLRALPSEIFRQYFMVGTDPFVCAVDPATLAHYLTVDPSLAQLTCYSSGYPDTEYTRPDEVAALLPLDWRRAVLQENASRFFGWTIPGHAWDGRGAEVGTGTGDTMKGHPLDETLFN
jgi:uncharacterized protein